ncbi:hypothetical protein CC78DRAFT_573147 [Lojkania enalia]|uniref:Uncharacterized protein n=1 Tax=Lojkania enalia TaxID=147567 RepID=A0A9P4NCU9_9PLEO|nr:hypothetical protein CC78DRAFT_573147 [Didymosphaeria enalia]
MWMALRITYSTVCSDSRSLWHADYHRPIVLCSNQGPASRRAKNGVIQDRATVSGPIAVGFRSVCPSRYGMYVGSTVSTIWAERETRTWTMRAHGLEGSEERRAMVVLLLVGEGIEIGESQDDWTGAPRKAHLALALLGTREAQSGRARAGRVDWRPSAILPARYRPPLRRIRRWIRAYPARNGDIVPFAALCRLWKALTDLCRLWQTFASRRWSDCYYRASCPVARPRRPARHWLAFTARRRPLSGSRCRGLRSNQNKLWTQSGHAAKGAFQSSSQSTRGRDHDHLRVNIVLAILLLLFSVRGKTHGTAICCSPASPAPAIQAVRDMPWVNSDKSATWARYTAQHRDPASQSLAPASNQDNDHRDHMESPPWQP